MKNHKRLFLALALFVSCTTSLAQTVDPRVLWKFETGG